MGRSREALDKAIPGVLARLAERLPAILIESLSEMWNDLETWTGKSSILSDGCRHR